MRFSIGLLLSLIGLLSCGADPAVQDNPVPDHVSSAPQSLAQEDTSALFQTLQQCDNLLFDIGFNTIDTVQVSQLIDDDFEFYHDEHGVTETKTDFIRGIASLRDLPFKTWRVLQPGSVEVFPMYRNGKSELYGAVQTGIHEFYQQKVGEEARKTSTASFTHLWILDNGNWKLKRVLSYDHH
jgi:hypothetical protein